MFFFTTEKMQKEALARASWGAAHCGANIEHIPISSSVQTIKNNRVVQTCHSWIPGVRLRNRGRLERFNGLEK